MILEPMAQNTQSAATMLFRCPQVMLRQRQFLMSQPNIIQRLATFYIHNLGNPSFFLSIQTIQIQGVFLLSQSANILDILHPDSMTNFPAISTPLSPYVKVVANDDQLFENPIKYQSVSGALQYLIVTRLDFSFPINFLCQHLHLPTQEYQAALKRVLQYIKGTLDHSLCFHPSSADSTIYTFSYSNQVAIPRINNLLEAFQSFWGRI